MRPIYILLILITVSCSTLKKPTTNNTLDKTNTPITSKIIFINYKISKTLNKNTKLTFINKIITDGNLKKNLEQEAINNIGDLICSQQDINSKTIDSIYIKNPLIKNIEYSNPSGELGRKTIKLDSTTLSVRMSLKPQTKFITLKLLKNINNSPLKIQL